MYQLTCMICNNTFESRFKDVKICDSCKNRPCEICGQSFVHKWPYTQKTCSKECQKILLNSFELKVQKEMNKKQNLLNKYGVDNVAKLDIVKDKIRASKSNKDEYLEQKERNEAERKHNHSGPIRKCIICGLEFEAVGSQTTCTREHLRQCIICGKEFPFYHISDKRQTCSDQCWRALILKNNASVDRVCAYCGRIFHSKCSNAKYCSGPHYGVCVICGNPFEIDFAKNGFTLETLPRTCSDKCSAELAQRTNVERYGVKSPHQLDEARKYFKQKSLDAEEHRKNTNYARYGACNPAKNIEVRTKISIAIGSEANQSRMRSTMQEKYGVDYAMQSSELASKHRASKSNIFACDGTRVDSTWEQLFYNFLYRNNIPFKYNQITIPYEHEGSNHVLHVDFEVNGIMFEIKGDHLLEGIGNGVPIEKKLELYRRNHIIVVCGRNVNNIFGRPSSNVSNGLKYLKKCPNPLIGVDIKLFDSDPVFPFAPDRPPYFYKVKVDGKRSSLEAFYDEKIRWSMILNRINYSGGFIDAKQVLNAMNVTRTCKQPSWFSKALAKRIIQTYCTSDTICDCFAGWGMRHDAAKELRRYYVGIDYNKEVVDWHQAHNRNIQWGDANKFKFDDVCSVFICPPYSDPITGKCFEDYDFEGFDSSAKLLSQCDWLKIVMQNVPNAKEYVMVCKIVDPGWDKYIVEKLTNKSHFGSNNEYIVCIKQTDRAELLGIN